MPRSVRQVLVAIAAMAVLAGSASAQVRSTGGELRTQDASMADIQRLQEQVSAIESDLATLRQRDRAAARALSAELSDLDDEVTYLKVKLRKEGHLTRAEYTDVRDRLENLRARVNGNDTSAGGYSTPRSSGTSSPTSTTPGTIPAGTEIDVRLTTALSSDTAQVEDRFEAITAVDLRQDGRVIIPAGSTVRGVVTGVKEAGRIDRKGSLTLSFDQITINGRNYPLRGTVTDVLESGGLREDAGKIGTGAAVGGIIGGILGGVKGALAGILIGGGGVVAATEGEDVELKPGTILRMRLDAPLSVRSNPTRR